MDTRYVAKDAKLFQRRCLRESRKEVVGIPSWARGIVRRVAEAEGVKMGEGGEVDEREVVTAREVEKDKVRKVGRTQGGEMGGVRHSEVSES